MKLFNSEEDAIKWVFLNIPLVVQAKKKSSKFPLIFPYISANAYQQIVEHLGKQLFKHQQTINDK